MDHPVPPIAWTRRLDQLPATPGHPAKATLSKLRHFLPAGVRFLLHTRRLRRQGRRPVINVLERGYPGPLQGVPLGGIGCGTIGRGWRGDFQRWSIRPGLYHHHRVPADAFSLYVRAEGQAPQAVVLSPERPTGPGLQAFGWHMPAACATYHGLFPRAWTVYQEPLPGVRLTCRQVSPVLPHNYEDSSLPVAIFQWQVENLTDRPLEVSLLFTFQSGFEPVESRAGQHRGSLFDVGSSVGSAVVGASSADAVAGDAGATNPGEAGAPLAEGPAVEGVLLRGRLTTRCLDMTTRVDPLSFALAAPVEADITRSRCTFFDAAQDGKAFWQAFAQDGCLSGPTEDTSTIPGQVLAGGLAQKVTLPAGGQRALTFALSWDAPIARFPSAVGYFRRYTRFFGHQGQAAPGLARAALQRFPAWEEAIAAWQAPILADEGAPDWYRALLFNELYFVTDGGTVWLDREERGEAFAEPGRFAWLEGHEYLMFNTYDVHFYAGFALLTHWPALELNLQRDVAEAIEVAHPERDKMLLSGTVAPRKLAGAVPHDLGAPVEDPWRLVNAYNAQDTTRWKDLNPKFVLQIYRAHRALEALGRPQPDFLPSLWPAVEKAMAWLEQFDQDGDGVIENEGYPDQTYDTWPAVGLSAYSGGLYLAALQAAEAMARILGQAEAAQRYGEQLARGQAAWEAKLWNGQYFRYDTGPTAEHVMADQLAGHWYARACGLPGICTLAQARSALETVFRLNVQGFMGGERGAVNGMRPDGSVDRTNLQAQEVWTGTTYAVAACMLQEGMPEEAFRTAHGVFLTGWQRFGYWFQTPEAWEADGGYRSFGYMRPLCIWAMQWARDGMPARLSPDHS